MRVSNQGAMTHSLSSGCERITGGADTHTSAVLSAPCHHHPGSRIRTLSNKGISPAVRITAKAPTGRTHPGASTVPGSAVPLAAIRGTTDVCSTVESDAAAAGRGATILVHCRPGATLPSLDEGGAVTKPSAAGARQRRAVVAEKSFMVISDRVLQFVVDVCSIAERVHDVSPRKMKLDATSTGRGGGTRCTAPPLNLVVVARLIIS